MCNHAYGHYGVITETVGWQVLYGVREGRLIPGEKSSLKEDDFMEIHAKNVRALDRSVGRPETVGMNMTLKKSCGLLEL